MLLSEIQIRGCAKSQRPYQKIKPIKCPLPIVKSTLYTLKTCIINWQENPARLISAWLQPHTTERITLDTILTHNLIKRRILAILAANLTTDERTILTQLRSKPFLFQLSLLWLHLKVYYTSIVGIRWLMTKSNFDKCWICFRRHYPKTCKAKHLQQTWNYILAGSIFFYRMRTHPYRHRYQT